MDAIALQQVSEGQTVQVTVAATDTDFADDIVFSLTDAGESPVFPVGATIDANTGEFLWRAPDDGVYEAFVIATDLSGASATRRLTINVVNLAPVVSPLSITGTLSEASPLTVTASATDAGENDTLTYLYEAILGVAVVDIASGIDLQDYVFVPADDGIYEIRVTVSDDNGDSGSSSQTVVVQNVVPTAADDDYETDEDSLLTVTAALGILSNDSDPADPLLVTQINGVDLVSGSTITLPSGAKLTIRSDGEFTYDPDGQFDSLAGGCRTGRFVHLHGQRR